MKFSMDGFRRHLSSDVSALKEIVSDVVNGDFYDKENLVDAMNDVITQSNVINCVYNPDDSNFNDISDLEIEHLEHNNG